MVLQIILFEFTIQLLFKTDHMPLEYNFFFLPENLFQNNEENSSIDYLYSYIIFNKNLSLLKEQNLVQRNFIETLIFFPGCFFPVQRRVIHRNQCP